MDTDDLTYRFAARQHGLLHTRHARAAGLTPRQIQHRVAQQDWEWATARVLRRPGAPFTIEQQVALALLDADPDAALCRETAAAWWELPGYTLRPDEVHVVRMRTGLIRRRSLATIHQPKLLLPHHVVQHRGLDVTTPARTLCDLAAVVSRRRLERTFDTVISRRLASLRDVVATFHEYGRRGRSGSAVMRELLEGRTEYYRATESGTEAEFERIIVAASLPAPERQVDIHDEQGFVARVDFLFRDAAFVAQVDGEPFHSALLDTAHDRAQDDRLRALGYGVRHFLDKEIWANPGRIVSTVRGLLVQLVETDNPIGA